MALPAGTVQVQFKTNAITDDYDILWDKPLGTGVNGDVVTCQRKTTQEKFALKCLEPREETRREIQLQFMSHNHPNIVRAYDVYDNTIARGPRDPRPPTRTYLMVMELMQGGELFERIIDKKSFTELEASSVMRQIVSAVANLHRMNIAHRDLKPENLLYATKDEESLLKLADFGFAKLDNGDLVTPVYTPYYAPGEILEAQRIKQAKKYGLVESSHVFAYDKSCDMWSLGVILYIILCGYPPFQSEIPGVQLSEGMKKKIKTGQFTFHEKYWGHISKEAKELVASLLCTDPQSRPPAFMLAKHPWIVGQDVQPILLKTPGTLQESTADRELAAAQYDEQLTVMRRRPPLILKPLGGCNNKLKLRRIGKAGQVTAAPGSVGPVPAAAAAAGGTLAAAAPTVMAAAAAAAAAAATGEHAPPSAMESIRAVDSMESIDNFQDAEQTPGALRRLCNFCLMPPPGASADQLSTLAKAAVTEYPDDFGLKQTLLAFGWCNEKFPPSVPLPNLGQALHSIISNM
eukprot:m.11362 g.11362  ORF g.11362 m.11362 type:complete len:518 (-) comp3986_c0_seq1:19-1572(-)